MKKTSPEIPYHVPQFVWKFWLSTTGPNDLPRDPRVHIYDVYDNELTETCIAPVTRCSVFQDFVTSLSTQHLVEAAEQAFYTLESEAEQTLNELMERTYSSGIPTKSTSFTFDKERITKLCRFLAFLRFRNSDKYREVLLSLDEPFKDHDDQGRFLPIFQPAFMEHHRRFVLRGMIAFLQNVSQDGVNLLPRDQPWPRVATALLDNFRKAMDTYCWQLCDADVCIGIASEDQEFLLTESCYGTLGEGFDEDPECCDLFFPILPTFALYILGNFDKDVDPVSGVLDSPNIRVDVGLESASDVHLRNAMILQVYPQYLYFSALRSVALSVSSYDEFRWIQEHQDYSRLKQRCRQKFLQETVTKTLVVKGSVILTDLTDEVVQYGTCAVGHGAFSDVWKAVWHDPVEKRSRNVALKVLRQIMVKNVKEKLMKRLQAEVIAWHRLCHRNISQLFGIVQFKNSIGMVSPWCENGTMYEYLKGNTTANRLDLLVQIASGVSYLHSATPIIVHGDLKGGNILIDGRGCPIITDFGLSKVIGDMSDSINIGSSFFAGSTRWMAPELIMVLIEDDGCVPPITTQSDVYAFASVCLEVATGSLPYPNRTNDHAVTVDILRGVKPSRGAHCHIQLKDVDAFWKTLDRCWNEAPFLRPAMNELVQILESMALRS